jgi:hypothetical protein
VTGADLHGAPDLVLAPHCPACDTVPASVRRMGLSVNFRFPPRFLGFVCTYQRSTEAFALLSSSKPACPEHPSLAESISPREGYTL